MSDNTDALIEDFRNRVRYHDVSYEYSDDGSVWRRGSAEKDEILRLAKLIPRKTAVEIWNARMDQYFVADEAPRWYWEV